MGQVQQLVPHLSPDGRRIAFLSYGNDVAPADHPYYKHVTLRLMPVEGGVPRVIAYVYGGQGTINVPSWSPTGRSRSTWTRCRCCVGWPPACPHRAGTPSGGPPRGGSSTSGPPFCYLPSTCASPTPSWARWLFRSQLSIPSPHAAPHFPKPSGTWWSPMPAPCSELRSPGQRCAMHRAVYRTGSAGAWLEPFLRPHVAHAGRADSSRGDARDLPAGNFARRSSQTITRHQTGAGPGEPQALTLARHQ